MVNLPFYTTGNSAVLCPFKLSPSSMECDNKINRFPVKVRSPLFSRLYFSNKCKDILHMVKRHTDETFVSMVQVQYHHRQLSK